MPFSEPKPERVWPAADSEAGRSGVGPVGLDARLPLRAGAPAGRRPENAQAAPAGLAGGAQARGARGGAGEELGGPGRTACIYPPRSLSLRGSNAHVAWAGVATQVPLHGPSRAGQLNPFLPPSLSPSLPSSFSGPHGTGAAASYPHL